MITRNLQSVSKSASNSNKYALIHAHKRNWVMINHTLSSNSVSTSASLPNNSKLSNNSSITYISRYCFSKTKQSTPMDTALKEPHTVLPFNVKLSDKDRQIVMRMITESLHSDTQQFILKQLRATTRERFQPSFIQPVIAEQISAEKTYFILSFIESTPNKSIKAIKDMRESEDIDIGILDTIEQSCEASMDAEKVYHGWIQFTSKRKTVNKLLKGAKPWNRTVTRFVSALNSNTQSMIIGYIDKTYEEQHIKTFKDVMIYALSLDDNSGGFYKTPKCVPSIETDHEITEKVIAKNVRGDKTDPLPPTDHIPTGDIPHVPLSVAKPRSVISERNIPKSQYILPSSMSINVVSASTEVSLQSYELDEIRNLGYRELQKLCKAEEIKVKLQSKAAILLEKLEEKWKSMQSVDPVVSHPAQSTMICAESLPPNDTIDLSDGQPISMNALKSEKYVNLDLMDRVRQVQTDVGEEAEKHDYRAKKLKTWHETLERKERVLEKEKEETKAKNDEIEQKEMVILQTKQDLLSIRQNERWNSLRNKRNTAEIEDKTRNLSVMEQKLNKQNSEQSVVQKELDQRQKVLDDKDMELKKESETILKHKQSIDERERKINEQIAILESDKTKYQQDHELLQQKQKEIMERGDQIKSDRKHIDIEKETLRNDKNDWMKKKVLFKERDEELSTKEHKYQEDIKALNQEKEKIKEDTGNIRNERDRNKRKANELNSMEQQLEARKTELSEKEEGLHCEQQILQRQQQEFKKLDAELKSNQHGYDIRMKKMTEDQQKLKEDKQRFEMDQYALNEKQTQYEQKKAQLDTEQQVLDKKTKYIEAKQLDIDRTKAEMTTLRATLEQKTDEIRKDRTELQQNKDWLEKQTAILEEAKEKLNAEKQDINKRFVDLNAARNEHQNDKIKTQQLQNELNTKQKEVDIKTKQNGDKEQEITQRYKKMNKEEQEIMRKIEPIKQKEKDLNERHIILEKRQKMNVEQQIQLETQKKSSLEIQQQLKTEKRELKEEEDRLQMLKKQLETKHDKINQHDTRIVQMYDTFNKEKYEVHKLSHTLTAKQTEITQREQKLEIQEQNVDEMQSKMDEDTQQISQRKQELEIMENSFNTKREALEIKQKEFEGKSEKYTSEQTELDKATKACSEQKGRLDQERIKIESDRTLIKEEYDYIKQQNQALSVQKKVLDAEKEKIDSKSLLLATRTQQMADEKEAQNMIRSKLEKIKSDLQSAQQRHKEEHEKLTIWSEDLQNEDTRLNELKQILDERGQDMEQKSLALGQQEVQVQKQQLRFQSEQMRSESEHIPKEKLETLAKELDKKTVVLEEQQKAIKREREVQKEKEELITMTKHQLLSDQSDVKQQEKQLWSEQQKVNAALKEADNAKYALKIEITRKESELSTKERALRDRDITISKQERKMRDKEMELKQTEDKLHKKENELSVLQRDLNIHREQFSKETKKKTYEMQSDMVHIEGEKSKLERHGKGIELAMEQQKMVVTEREKALHQQIQTLRLKRDVLQHQLDGMENNTLQQTHKMQKLSEQNSVLYMDKQLLQQKIARNEQKEKELKRPMDEWKRKLKDEQIQNENEQRKSKHLVSTLKRRERSIESQENQMVQQQQRLTTQQSQLQQQQHDIDTMMLNLQKQLSLTEQTQKDAENAKQIHDGKTKLVTGLQTNLKRTQELLGHKDALIYRLQNELVGLTVQKQQDIVSPKPEVIGVPLSATSPISAISQRNKAYMKGRIPPQSIAINDPSTVISTIHAPQIMETVKLISVPIPGKIIAQTIPTIHAPQITETVKLISVPLSTADPTPITSKRNKEFPGKIIAQTIPINDALEPSVEILKPAREIAEDVGSPMQDTDRVWTHPMIRDEMPTQDVPSIPFRAAAPTAKVSKQNVRKLPSYKHPYSMGINPATPPSFDLLTTPQQRILDIQDEADDLPPKKPKPKPKLHVDEEDKKPRRYKPYPPKPKPKQAPFTPKTEGIRTVEAFVELFDAPTTKQLPEYTWKDIPAVAFSVAAPTPATSKRNTQKIEYITPASIQINDPTKTAEKLVATPQQERTIDLSYIATHDVPSVPFSVADAVSVISKRNQPKIKYVIPSSIGINDALLTSATVVPAPQQLPSTIDKVLPHPMNSGMIIIDSLPPTDTIPTADILSIALSVAQSTSVISKRNRPKSQYIAPSSMSINDPTITSENVVSAPTISKPDVISHPEESRMISVESLPPNDIIATANVPSIALSEAQPRSVISKRNIPKPQYIAPDSISINDPHITSERVIAPAAMSQQLDSVITHPIKSGIISVESLPPTDIIPTANVQSIDLYTAEPTPVLSRRNIVPTDTVPSSLSINDSQITSQKVVSSPSMKIPAIDIVSAFHVAQPTPITSKRNEPKINYTIPSSIAINDPLWSSEPVIPTFGAFSTVQPTSNISRHNQPKLASYIIASSIPITCIIEATDDVLYHPSPQTVLDTAKFVEGLRGLKQLHDIEDSTQVKPEQDVMSDIEEPSITDFPEPEPELQSNLNATDLDTLFQCNTNPDLLFDDIAHLETIFLGLDEELHDCLSECRDYKSIMNPLPSAFKPNITDLNTYGQEVFTGDVICCLEWKLDNDSFESIMNEIQRLITTCDEHIHSNRECMEQYNIAMNDDKKRSISNRNKLRQMNHNKTQNKMNIYNINKDSVEFKNDLSHELLELQYTNSEWLLLRSTLNEWMEYIQKAMDNDRAAFISSDTLSLRAFCILPSQPQNDRKYIVYNHKSRSDLQYNHFERYLRCRKWIEEINSLLSIKHDFGILYGEMGPDVSNWEDKLLIRDLTSYVLNGTTFELHSTLSSRIPLSEGFVRIGFQAQLLIESAQSLLGHMDPYIERIVTVLQNWCKTSANVDSQIHGQNKANVSNLESSLKNGQDLLEIDPLTLRDKTPLQRAKLLENDAKYVSLFRDPLSVDLDELLQDIKTRKTDNIYIHKLCKFLSQYFHKLYRDKLMLPTPNSTIIEETAPETWQKHALLEAVCSDEFGKIVELLSTESLTRQICHFASHDVYSSMQSTSGDQQKQKERKEEQMFYELFKPFEAFKQYHTQNVKQKLYEIVSDFDIQQYLSESVYQNALRKKLAEVDRKKNTKKWDKWSKMAYTDRSLAPQQFVRDEAVALSAGNDMPAFSSEEGLATYWTGYLKGVLHNVPVERPLRLGEHYHDIELKTDGDSEHDGGHLKHLKQHYYIDSYKPPSHEDVAPRISVEDRMNGVDIYRDKYIQRPHQSKRILQTQLKFLYHNKSDYMRGAFPLENFNYLPYGTKKPVKHRVTVRKSPFVQARAQENYETRIYTKVATNYKVTSNRTADMFNARGFDLLYDSVRVM